MGVATINVATLIGFYVKMNKKNSIYSQIEDLKDRIFVLSERLYRPDISISEQREINKRKKKLLKNKEKLEKRLDKSKDI